MQCIEAHSLPPDERLFLYGRDGATLRQLLWFKVTSKGEFVSEAMTASPHVFEAIGQFSNGVFSPHREPIRVDGRHHRHLTVHNPKGKYGPQMHGPGGRRSQPQFDASKLDGLREVVRHILAPSQMYPRRIASNQYFEEIGMHAQLGHQVVVVFRAAPWDRNAKCLPDQLIAPLCFLYARVSPPGLPFDVLVQVGLGKIQQYGDETMHIMAAPIADGSDTQAGKHAIKGAE